VWRESRGQRRKRMGWRIYDRCSRVARRRGFPPYRISRDGDGKAVWAPFSKHGTLANSDTSWASASEKVGGTIAIKFTLQPGEEKMIPMVIAWDFPVVEFGQGRKWNRRYTDFYGTSGRSSWAIASDGLLHSSEWSNSRQQPYIQDESKPACYRGLPFNELISPQSCPHPLAPPAPL